MVAIKLFNMIFCNKKWLMKLMISGPSSKKSPETILMGFSMCGGKERKRGREKKREKTRKRERGAQISAG